MWNTHAFTCNIQSPGALYVARKSGTFVMRTLQGSDHTHIHMMPLSRHALSAALPRLNKRTRGDGAGRRAEAPGRVM